MTKKYVIGQSPLSSANHPTCSYLQIRNPFFFQTKPSFFLIRLLIQQPLFYSIQNIQLQFNTKKSNSFLFSLFSFCFFCFVFFCFFGIFLSWCVFNLIFIFILPQFLFLMKICNRLHHSKRIKTQNKNWVPVIKRKTKLAFIIL